MITRHPKKPSCTVRERLRSMVFSPVLCAILFTTGAAVQAQPYEQTQGEGYTVCEAFERVLSDRSLQNPMVCEVDLGDNPHGFSRPDWEELSLEEPENLDLFRVLDQAFRNRRPSPANDNKPIVDLTPEEWQRDFQWRQEQPNIGEPRLLKAKLGLDGEGEDETVMAISWGTEQCRQSIEAGSRAGSLTSGPYALFLYDETKGEVNLELTKGVLTGTGGFGFDPLIFQGRAFLVAMMYSPSSGSNVYVNAYFEGPVRAGAVSRCTFEADPRR
ncbi:MAG: hypothetical protein ACX931_02475 [Saccharospirillum sp.]